MTESTDTKDAGQLPELDEVPDGAMVLQCGRVLSDDGVIGRIDPKSGGGD